MPRNRWLLLLYALPTPRNAARVNLWRKLRKFGAVQLKTSGYILPDEPAHLERFQWLGAQIRDAGGQTTLIRVAEIDGMSHDDIVNLFNNARSADYKELAATCHETLARHKKKKTPDLASELAKLKQRFSEIREIDYFTAPAAHKVQIQLARLERALIPRMGSPTLQKLNAGQFEGNIWLTRPRPGIDRAGSAWLIRKFIDPKARFVFDMDPSNQPNALPFDMAGVEFSHHADDCTFETLIKRFGIGDKAVLKMAEMVHDADLEDGKFGRYECLGINAVLSGWARSGVSDQELLTKGIDCFEGLYQQLRT
jgi:hypothetical protein